MRGCLNAALGLVAMGTEKSTNRKMMHDVGGRPAGEQGAQPECVSVCVRARAHVRIRQGGNRHKVQRLCADCAAARRRKHMFHVERKNRPGSCLFIGLPLNDQMTFGFGFKRFAKPATEARSRPGAVKVLRSADLQHPLLVSVSVELY